jgi:hypothetical protein
MNKSDDRFYHKETIGNEHGALSYWIETAAAERKVNCVVEECGGDKRERKDTLVVIEFGR